MLSVWILASNYTGSNLPSETYPECSLTLTSLFGVFTEIAVSYLLIFFTDIMEFPTDCLSGYTDLVFAETALLVDCLEITELPPSLR